MLLQAQRISVRELSAWVPAIAISVVRKTQAEIDVPVLRDEHPGIETAELVPQPLSDGHAAEADSRQALHDSAPYACLHPVARIADIRRRGDRCRIQDVSGLDSKSIRIV